MTLVEGLLAAIAIGVLVASIVLFVFWPVSTVFSQAALPDGELAILPRSTHGLIVEKPDLLARVIRDFHAPDKANGVAPLRRHPDGHHGAGA